MKTFLIIFCMLGLMQLSAVNSLHAQTLTAQQQRELNAINTTLKSNPQLISSMHKGLNNYLTQLTKQDALLTENRDWLFNNSVHPILGDAKAAHKIIVFTDYDCPYCKRLEPELEKLIAKHPSVQVINILVPLRQQQPAGAQTSSALLALDLWRSHKTEFDEAHQLLMKKSGLHTAASLQQIAELTASTAFLSASAQSKQIIERNLAVFTQLGLRGTPAILIGDQVIPGFVTLSTLLEVTEKQFLLK
ncbi:Protein-disulfide isomerase [Arsukibacterium tuosuense]|uniref:Protein-disulfide isomerase n=1 Tax=Arsukibacterium tuosuense TaxID=1323745 RepID=A0A285IWK7_9GAMM|nr:DsbA family protein [Arsukibacterium tuosuense]SNY52430.1 Protein-disulfide isomerase [Arsukibacterium tuosuense]